MSVSNNYTWRQRPYFIEDIQDEYGTSVESILIEDTRPRWRLSIFLAIFLYVLVIPRQLIFIHYAFQFQISSTGHDIAQIMYLFSLTSSTAWAAWSIYRLVYSRKASQSRIHLSENNTILFLQLLIMIVIDIVQAIDVDHSDTFLYSLTFGMDVIHTLVFHCHLVCVGDFPFIHYPHNALCILSLIYSFTYGLCDIVSNFYHELPGVYLRNELVGVVMALTYSQCIAYRLKIAWYNFRKLYKPYLSIFLYHYVDNRNPRTSSEKIGDNNFVITLKRTQASYLASSLTY